MRKYSDVKKMSDEELKEEFASVAERTKKLAEYVGNVNNDDEEEKFSSDVAGCIESLHDLRMVITAKYFNVLK